MSTIKLDHGDRAHVFHSGTVVTRNGSWLDRVLMLRGYLPRLLPGAARPVSINEQTPKAT